MKKIFIKCFISLGLFLFLTVALPELTPDGVKTAYANEVEKEKSDGYRLNLKSIVMVKGKTFPLPLKVYNLSENAKVSFKSADTEIASVSDDGTITAKMVGVTTITATIKDGLGTHSLTCEVTVGPPAFSVKMTRSRIILGVDGSETIEVVMKPSNTAETARFSVHEDYGSVVSISPGGRVTGKKVGFTIIYAVIDALNLDGSNKFAYCSAIVVNSDDVQPLETYFSEHPELNMISEGELNTALAEFFNDLPASANSTPSSTAKAPSLVESLDKFLDGKFNLTAIRKDLAAKATENVQK